MDVKVIPKKTVTVIQPAKDRTVDRSKYDQLRVAAYCRVSTNSEEQLTSYEMQKKVYTELIQGKPEWCIAGIYADEGISGTRADKRDEFQRMIKDCYKHRIDYIITKSVSRFARNTAECIEFVRQLKALGIGVIFEEQNCDTLKCDSELLLTIHAGFAQAESESMSRNITWSYRKKFEQGEVMFNYKKMVGYRKGTDGKPEIIPEEAEIIRQIFDMYLAGMTLREIRDKLHEEGVETKCGKVKWSISTLQSILRNEKYCGDAILQKTITVDPISKIHKKNTGEAPMYYVKDNHVGIISHEDFNRTQEEIAKRMNVRPSTDKNSVTGQGKYSRYALSDILRCGECGTKFRRITWSKKGKKKIVWRCGNRLDYGTQFCSTAPTVEETELQRAIVRAMSLFSKEEFDEFNATMEASIGDALGISADASEVDMLTTRIKQLENEMVAEIDKSVSRGFGLDEGEDIFKRISDEIEQLTSRLNALQEQGKSDAERQNRIQSAKDAMAQFKDCTILYNDTAVRKMIECIRVYNDGKLEVIFGGGYTVEERVEIIGRNKE